MAKEEHDNQLGVWLDAVTHDLRRSILALMWQRHPLAQSPSELAVDLSEPLSNVSYHMRRLRSYHKAIQLVDSRDEQGSVQHFYQLKSAFREQAWIINVLEQEGPPL